MQGEKTYKRYRCTASTPFIVLRLYLVISDRTGCYTEVETLMGNVTVRHFSQFSPIEKIREVSEWSVAFHGKMNQECVTVTHSKLCLQPLQNVMYWKLY